MSDRIPYTYFVFHIPTGLKYYGSKYGKGADPKTFWIPGGYFTSSNEVKNLIEEYGVNSFNTEVRKIFKTPDEALKYEYRFLKRVNALGKKDWLNKNLGGEKFKNVGPASEKALQSQRRKKQTSAGNAKRSASLKGRIISEKTRKKMSEVQKNRNKDKENERRNKIRSHAIGRKHSDEVKKYLSKTVSETRWINNGEKQKKIHKDELETFLSIGWMNGRILTNVTCPHCGITGVTHNIVRKHFDKCRERK